MKKTNLTVAVLLAVAPAASAQTTPSEPPPPLSLKLTDETAEAAVRPSFSPGSWKLLPVLRAGVLDPLGTLPAPYSVLQPSPYAIAGLDAFHSGAVESLVLATVGYSNVNSQKGISDPQQQAVSLASHAPTAQSKFSQDWATASLYGDLGKVVRVSPWINAAFFAAADAFGVLPVKQVASYSAAGQAESNAGALLMFKKGPHEATVFGDVRVEAAMRTMYRNADFTAVPAGTVGAEYAREVGGHRLAGGVETTVARGDVGVRPYLEWSHEKVAAVAAGNFRRSLSSFYPDVAGAGAELRVEPVPGLRAAVSGSAGRESYSMAPAPVDTYGMMASLTVNYERLLQGDAAKRVRVRQEAARQYSAQDSYDMNSRVPNLDGHYAEVFTKALGQAPTFTDFVKSIPARGTDGVLAAVAAFTASFGDKNYNDHEGPVPNADNIEELYERGRASFLTGQKDPMLVCIGSSQFAAYLAEALGRQAGVPIEAMASIVDVPDDKGQRAGHAIAAIKTREYGIVFVDWGRLTPTYTFDTRQAMAIYQALQGIPALYHTVTAGADGHHIGYLFTEEGKAFVRNETFHSELPQPVLGRIFNDDPRGDALTVERFKDLARRKF